MVQFPGLNHVFGASRPSAPKTRRIAVRGPRSRMPIRASGYYNAHPAPPTRPPLPRRVRPGEQGWDREAFLLETGPKTAALQEAALIDRRAMFRGLTSQSC